MAPEQNTIESIEAVADLIERGDIDESAASVDGEDADDDNAAEPRAMGYNVEAINADYAMVLLGGRAVIVKEQPGGPVEDRVRIISIEAFDHWHSNKFTETRGADGKIKTTTWAKAWRSDRHRRQYAGIEFFPNPDQAEATPGYLNLWRGFTVEPSETGTWRIFRDHLLVNVCQIGRAHV